MRLRSRLNPKESVTAQDRNDGETVDIWTLPFDKIECRHFLDRLALAVELHSRMLEVVPTKCRNANCRRRLEKPKMESDYVYLCGVIWCKYGQHDAGKELLRAVDTEDPDMQALAWAMFVKGSRRLKELEKAAQPSSSTIVRGQLCG
jgi:hypothetical protein